MVQGTMCYLHPGWKPPPFHHEQAQARQKKRNQQDSRRRRAATRYLSIGGKVILKDRKPGWKFRTPYEPGIWTVSKIMGTMITALRGCERVTRNILWFWKVNLPKAPQEEPGVEGSMWESERGSHNTQVSEDSGSVRPGSLNQPGPLAGTDQPEVVPPRS
ncbi:hypothetical protein NDU88_000587 [Pleurodeles waltl]|uniref:Uncharacterized protein n=1 Tax=Pleurodeles waltl TaxID=8319 RepID=A0AAV7P8P3_PLEWA|nr:hypothetical protein NDU88_000587 [Pleurodeles waltl]